MWKIKQIGPGDKITNDMYNEIVVRLNQMTRVFGNVSGHLTTQGFHLTANISSGGGGTTLRYAMVAENPLPKNSIKINIMSGGIPASSGGEFEVECYASILNGERLDMVAPVLVMGSILPVMASDFGIAVDINAWDTNVIYRSGEQVSASSKVYRSLTEDNQGNAVSDTDFWLQYTEWNSETAYVIGDISESGDLLYKCILAHTNNVPPNATYWELLERISNSQWCFVVPFTAIRNVSF